MMNQAELSFSNRNRLTVSRLTTITTTTVTSTTATKQQQIYFVPLKKATVIVILSDTNHYF